MAIVYDPMSAITDSLGQIAEAAAQYINPFHNLQVAMRNKILQDKDLAQKLSDLNDSSPGLLKAFGLGKVGDEIAKIPPSAAQIIKRNTQAALEQASQNPANQQIRATKEVTGMTPSDVTKEGAAQTVLTQPGVAAIAGTKDVTGLTPTQIMQENIEAGNIAAAQQYFAKNPDASVNDVANGLLSGKLSLKDAGALYTIPGIGKSLSESVNAKMHLADINAMMQWRKSMKDDQFGDALDKIKLTRAAIAWQQMGMAGDPGTLSQYMFDPATRQHAMDLLANPSSAKTVQDQQLLQTVQGVQRFDQAKRSQQVSQAGTTIRIMSEKIASDIGKMNPSAQEAALQGLQSMLNVRASFGAQQLTAHIGKVPGASSITHWFGGPTTLYYTDARGNVVSPDVATSQSGIDPQIQSLVNKAYTNYLKAPAAQRQQLLQGTDPEIRDLLMQRIQAPQAPQVPSGDQ